ncbi:transposase, MuDR, MULE transposase domain protein [Tanacetum coccineum]|uniref:Transposase, MuDR, MULE transposase domain protein n=1 Tax=Tanacetum coccineum TaxID=301880 RepID=A0ABQ5C552_9ASTR
MVSSGSDSGLALQFDMHAQLKKNLRKDTRIRQKLEKQMNAKLAWITLKNTPLLRKPHIVVSSSADTEIGDMDSNFTNENDPWEYSLDIDDSDLHLTPVPRSFSSAHKVVEDVGEDADFNSGACVSATNYVNAFGGTVTKCLGDIDNFLKKRKLEQVVAIKVIKIGILPRIVFIFSRSRSIGILTTMVAIVKSCSPNALGDLNVTLKDLSGTVPGTIHYKVLDVGSYEKDITVGAVMILVNVSVFTPKLSKHYLNITKRNVIEVFRKNTVSLA